VNLIDDVIEYSGMVIRPPSEAESIIFQITLGCSDNGCIFCPAYKEKKFSVRGMAAIEKEMQTASRAFPDARRIFFADGDALAAGMQTLRDACVCAIRYFPKLSRIALYGSAKSIEPFSVQDLRELASLKLTMVYIGFETGDPGIYAGIHKYGTPDKNAAACKKVMAAGMTANATVILGLAGTERTADHAVNTAHLLNDARPQQIAALTLMIAENTPLAARVQRGAFSELKTFEYLSELKMMLENLDDFPCIFMADHASNYLPVRARFPRDRRRVISEIESILSVGDLRTLVPENRRGL